MPSGAQVFVGSEKTTRGTTPYVLELKLTDAPVGIRLARVGYKSMKKMIAANSDNKLTFALEKAADSPSVIVRPSLPGAMPDDSDDSDGMMDPFKKKGMQ